MVQIISQSEVDSFLSCKRRHFYAHGEKIRPIQDSGALNRGSLGHEALDTYFTERKSGASFDAAEKAAFDVLNSHLTDSINLKTITELTPLLRTWFEWARTALSQWTILEIEKEYRYEIPGTDLVYPLKVDLLIEQGGRIYVVDNKFVQDFYSDHLLTVLPQLAKYVGALRLLGIPVHDGVYNMIRTRPLLNKPIEEKIRVQQCNLKDSKIKQYLKEQFSAMKQIAALRNAGLEVWEERYALRTANQFNCRGCPYLDLCSLDLTGNTGRELHVKTFYKPNDYGYAEVEVDAN